MNIQALSPETGDEQIDVAALSTLANPRRVRWSALYSANYDSE